MPNCTRNVRLVLQVSSGPEARRGPSPVKPKILFSASSGSVHNATRPAAACDNVAKWGPPLARSLTHSRSARRPPRRSTREGGTAQQPDSAAGSRLPPLLCFLIGPRMREPGNGDSDYTGFQQSCQWAVSVAPNEGRSK